MVAKVPEIATRIRAKNAQQPFFPFDVRTADGDTFHIRHPDFAILSSTRDTIEIYDKDEHLRIVNVRMIVSIEDTRPAKGLFGHGGGKR